MRSRNSLSEPPIVVPWPHMVSRTGTTVDVADSAFVRALARRERASVREAWLALPGLGGLAGLREGVKDGAGLLEVV